MWFPDLTCVNWHLSTILLVCRSNIKHAYSPGMNRIQESLAYVSACTNNQIFHQVGYHMIMIYQKVDYLVSRRSYIQIQGDPGCSNKRKMWLTKKTWSQNPVLLQRPETDHFCVMVQGVFKGFSPELCLY